MNIKVRNVTVLTTNGIGQPLTFRGGVLIRSQSNAFMDNDLISGLNQSNTLAEKHNRKCIPVHL